MIDEQASETPEVNESEDVATPSPSSEGSGEENNSPAPERPDWLPEKFWNKDEGAPNVENLAKSYAELERLRGKDPDAIEAEFKQKFEQERLASRPEDPTAYKLPENDAFDMEQLEQSPVVEIWRKAAHEAGLGQEQFEGVLNQYAQTEMERMQAHQEAELKKLGENAMKRTEAVGLWATRVFGEDSPQRAAINRIASDAAGVEALEKLMQDMSDQGGAEQYGSQGGSEELTRKDIETLMQDKRYWKAGERDPAVVKKVEDWFAKNG